MSNWMKLPGCQYIASTNCDFSSLKISVYDEVKLRVRAEEGNSTSPWRELGPFIPYEEGEKKLLAESRRLLNVAWTASQGQWCPTSNLSRSCPRPSCLPPPSGGSQGMSPHFGSLSGPTSSVRTRRLIFVCLHQPLSSALGRFLKLWAVGEAGVRQAGRLYKLHRKETRTKWGTARSCRVFGWFVEVQGFFHNKYLL